MHQDLEHTQLRKHRLKFNSNRSYVRGFKLQESIGLFRAGDDIYQVTYVYNTENARQATSVFNQIVNTFKATPTAAALTPVI